MQDKGQGQLVLILYPSLYLFDLWCLQLHLQVSQRQSEVFVLRVLKGLPQQGGIPPQLDNHTGDIVSLCESGFMTSPMDTFLGGDAFQT